MPKPTMIVCRDCRTEFEYRPGKPGFINQCEDCADDVPKLGGNMVYDHKTAPTIEIKSMKAAVAFNKATYRKGYGTLATHCSSPVYLQMTGQD